MNEEQKKIPNWKINKVKYTRDYEKENVKQVKFKLNKKTESDIIEYLESKENKQGYIKQLIRDDMAKK